MAPAPARSATQRKADTLAMLATPEIDGWVATAGAPDGEPLAHLVPLSLAWIDGRVVIAIEASSRTARNLVERRTARLGVGPTRDVVMIDAVLAEACPVHDAPPALAERYVAQAGWDPGEAAGSYVYLTLVPRRIQAWREANEIPGRTIMRDGGWLV